MPNSRGVQNGIRQSFIYRGIQVMPSLDGGWLATIGARLYNEAGEDDICFAIDAAHLIIELQHERAGTSAGCAPSHQAISGGGRRSSPSHGSRRYSTSTRGAA